MRKITTGDFMHVHGGFGENVDYTYRLTVELEDPVDPEILKKALASAQKRYPYLCVKLCKNEYEYYYEDNPLPVVLLHTDDRICLNSEETNFHAWAVCYHENRIHLDGYHGLVDGAGIYRVLATLMYYYCAERYGVPKIDGVLTAEDPIMPEETVDPQDLLEAPSEIHYPQAPFKDAFTLETDGGLTPSGPTLWDIEIPEEAFIRFTSAHDASPGTMISLLFARAIDQLYPDRQKEIISVYVINARPMLNADMTYHNCLSMAIFEYSDRIKKMPLAAQCTVYRGKTFIQSDADRVKEIMSVNADAIRQGVGALATLEEKKSAFEQAFNAGEGKVSFLVSYTGKWKYPETGRYMQEFWTHPPNTFSLMAEIGAVNGKIFLTVQQRFREDTVREAFLTELEKHGIPYRLCRVMESDVAHMSEP